MHEDAHVGRGVIHLNDPRLLGRGPRTRSLEEAIEAEEGALSGPRHHLALGIGAERRLDDIAVCADQDAAGALWCLLNEPDGRSREPPLFARKRVQHHRRPATRQQRAHDGLERAVVEVAIRNHAHPFEHAAGASLLLHRRPRRRRDRAIQLLHRSGQRRHAVALDRLGRDRPLALEPGGPAARPGEAKRFIGTAAPARRFTGHLHLRQCHLHAGAPNGDRAQPHRLGGRHFARDGRQHHGQLQRRVGKVQRRRDNHCETSQSRAVALQRGLRRSRQQRLARAPRHGTGQRRKPAEQRAAASPDRRGQLLPVQSGKQHRRLPLAPPSIDRARVGCCNFHGAAAANSSQQRGRGASLLWLTGNPKVGFDLRRGRIERAQLQTAKPVGSRNAYDVAAIHLEGVRQRRVQHPVCARQGCLNAHLRNLAQHAFAERCVGITHLAAHRTRDPRLCTGPCTTACQQRHRYPDATRPQSGCSEHQAPRSTARPVASANRSTTRWVAKAAIPSRRFRATRPSPRSRTRSRSTVP